LDPIAHLSLLYDFYGALLTLRQQEVMKLYHEENLSLSEIAEEFGISRQGVHDTLKNAEHALLEYEKKLGLVAKLEQTKTELSTVDRLLAIMVEQNRNNTYLVEQLSKVKEIMDHLSE